jgi:ABC-type Na+ efflux pump permease subunit
MRLGLFVRRALITFARSGTVFPDRVAAVIAVAAVVAGCVLFWDQLGWDRTTIAGATWFGHSTFGLVVGIRAVLAMSVVVGQVAPSIASERERKSLDSLLGARLSSAEIVVGMMVTGLVRSANWLAATIPIVVLIAIVAGVQPLLVLLCGAGLGSSVFAAAALAVAVSVCTPNRSKAIAVSIGLLVAWFDIPLFAELLLLRGWRGAPRWIVHTQHWLVDSSPGGVGMSVFLPTLVPRPFGLIEAILRMIAIQLCGSSLLVLWAVWQLRPASRALHDGDWPKPVRWMWRAIQRRPRPRRPCGRDPVLWNELHSQRAASLAGRVVAAGGQLVGIGVLALGTSWFAVPAFTELAQRGYGAAREGFATPEINPLARVLIGKLLIPAGTTPRGQARLEFNAALRQFSALFVMLSVVMVCGTAAMSIIQERERDTWQSLIATSLTPWEILRAKMLAAIWRARGASVMLIALWAVGVAAGAVHPLGFFNAVAGLIAIGAFYSAMGILLSLLIGKRKQINNMLLLVVLCVLPLSGLAILLPGTASVFLGACSPPFLIWSSLFSYEDVQSVINSGVLPQLGATSIKPGVSARMVLAACWFATIAHAAGAFFLTRATCRRFDVLVGRPALTRSNNSRTHGKART